MPDVDLTVVTMTFDASDPVRVASLLAKYAVLTRGQAGCRNLDLLASATRPGRYLVISKWETAEAQRAHFDSAELVELAESCRGVLDRPPQIDLYDAVSAHDLQ